MVFGRGGCVRSGLGGPDVVVAMNEHEESWSNILGGLVLIASLIFAAWVFIYAIEDLRDRVKVLEDLLYEAKP